ncbi:unnamed protein product [Closterium sp. Naga37s-1]|nr:unnamed protein product [Closterium sp. Naga37s-1]
MRLSLSDSVDDHPASANHATTPRACSRRTVTWSAAEKKENGMRGVAAAGSTVAPVMRVEDGAARAARAAGCLDALIALKSAQIDAVRRERVQMSAELAEGVKQVRSMETGMAERRRVIESLIARISEKQDMKCKEGATLGKGTLGEAVEGEGTEDDMGSLYDDEDEDMLEVVGCDGVGSSAEELRAMLKVAMHEMMTDLRQLELAALHAQYRSGEIRGDMRRKSAEMVGMREAREQLVRRKDQLVQQQLLLPAG